MNTDTEKRKNNIPAVDDQPNVVVDNGVTDGRPPNEVGGDVTSVPEERQPWFAPDGSLLLDRYPFVLAQIEAEALDGIPELSDFPHHAPLAERIGWAKAHKWAIGGLYLRCSTDWQDSYAGQIGECVTMALRKRILVFPELMVGDEGVSGKKGKRLGFQALRRMIEERRIDAIVTFSVSRWFRSLPKGLIFIREEVVDNGIRAVAKAESFDTNDSGWSDYLTLNLFVAEKMASGQSVFVRMGHRALFEAGYLIGACPLGYRPEVMPNAGLTKQKKPKTRQVIHPRVAPLIVKHFGLIDGGMSIAEGVRLWNEEIATWPPEDRKFAVDPRSQGPFITRGAYFKMLRREDYIGRVAYGETRSRWLGKKDRVVQEKAPEGEALYQQREDLRIMDDELFQRVQRLLDSQKIGQHGSRMKANPPFHDRIVSLFHCGSCGHRHQQQSTRYMHCTSPDHVCAENGTVHRKQAAEALVAALRKEVLGNTALMEAIIRESQTLDRDGDGTLEREIAEREKAVKGRQNQMRLMEMLVQSGEADAETQARYLDTGRQVKIQLAELERLRRRKTETSTIITPEQVREILERFDKLLRRAAAGELGADGNAEAVAIVRKLTGGRIDVFFHKREDRSRQYGWGTFRPALSKALREHGKLDTGPDLAGEKITLQLRPLPLFERMADEVHRLYEEEGSNLCEIARRLGHNNNVAWRAFRYWYQSRNLPRPTLPLGAPNRPRTRA